MDNHLLTSASEDTLVTAIGTVEITSATNLHSGQDTPYPETRLSSETMQLLEDTAARLEPKNSVTMQPSKRRRLEPNEDMKRTNYPQASKSVYLKTKTLHRKKLSLATNIHQIKKLLSENKFPLQADFNSKVPMSRDQAFRNKWVSITNKCKLDLSNLILQDLGNKYQTTKLEIDTNLAELQELLTNNQFMEIKKFLQTKYKQAMNTTFSKTATKLTKRKPTNNQRKGQPQGRRTIIQRRAPQQQTSKTDLKSVLVTLLQNL